MDIKKRDGRMEPFNKQKIVDAVEAAMAETTHGVNDEVSNLIANTIENACKSEMLPCDVESIQDTVERMLMAQNCFDAAKRYILYRDEHTKTREHNQAILDKVWERSVGKGVVNSNANCDEKTFSGRKNEAGSVVQKELALDKLMSKEVAEAHRQGLIYQHDLDSYLSGQHNCLFIDFKHLFENGIKLRNCDLRPPHSFATACQLVAVFMQLQSLEQFGGVASAHIDRDLAPYVHMSFTRHLKDGMKYIEKMSDAKIAQDFDMYGETNIIGGEVKEHFPGAYQYALDMLEREGKQAVEGLYHNLNSLQSRGGGQLPFSSLNYGRDTSPEGRMVTRWMLEASLAGIGEHHTTSIFPIGIFSVKKGVNFNPEDPNYDLYQLALKSLSKRIYPNLANGDWSEAHEDPDDPDTTFATMGGCKLQPM